MFKKRHKDIKRKNMFTSMLLTIQVKVLLDNIVHNSKWLLYMNKL